MRFAYRMCVLAALGLFTQCTSGENNRNSETAETGSANQGESSFATSDPNATNTVKRGMVVASPTPKRLKGSEKDKETIYRFQPFDHDQMQLRLTKASNDDGKGIAEEQEIDLAPYANKIIEVQGTSFGRRWVFDANINGIVAPDGDTARARTPGGDPSLNTNGQ